MIWHISIKLRTSKGFKGFFKSVVVGVFACQLFMWHFLVSSHGVFVSISNGGSSIKTLLLIVCNFMVVERDCREAKKRTSLLRFFVVLFIVDCSCYCVIYFWQVDDEGGADARFFINVIIIKRATITIEHRTIIRVKMTILIPFGAVSCPNIILI